MHALCGFNSGTFIFFIGAISKYLLQDDATQPYLFKIHELKRAIASSQFYVYCHNTHPVRIGIKLKRKNACNNHYT